MVIRNNFSDVLIRKLQAILAAIEAGGGGGGSDYLTTTAISDTVGNNTNVPTSTISPTPDADSAGKTVKYIASNETIFGRITTYGETTCVVTTVAVQPISGGGTNFYQARLARRIAPPFGLNDYLPHTLSVSNLYAFVHGVEQISPISFSGVHVGDLFFISDYGFDYDPSVPSGGPNTTYALCTVVSVAADGNSLVYRASAIFHKFVQYTDTINLTSQEDADYISGTTFGNSPSINVSGLTEDVTIDEAVFYSPVNISGNSNFRLILRNVKAPGIAINGPSKVELIGCVAIMVMGNLTAFSAKGCMGIDFRANSVVTGAQLNYCSNIVIESTASVTINSISEASIIEVNKFQGGVFQMPDGTPLANNSQFGRVVNTISE